MSAKIEETNPGTAPPPAVPSPQEPGQRDSLSGPEWLLVLGLLAIALGGFLLLYWPVVRAVAQAAMKLRG